MKKIKLFAIVPAVLAAILAAVAIGRADTQTTTPATTGSLANPTSGHLPSSHLTITSIKDVDLDSNIATLPLYKATVNGASVWYVITDVSDRAIAQQLGVNFAPRLANADNGCPGCIETVSSTAKILGQGDTQFQGTIDFSPARVYTPSATGFPPINAQPGGMADAKYSPLVRIAGTNVVYDAPIVATGDGPFDVTHHTNTSDRVMQIDTNNRTVGLLFIRAFSNGKSILYFNFEGSDAGVTSIERSSFAPGLALIPFAGASDNASGTRAALFTFANGKLGPTSPPAQGLMHVAIDGKLSEEANLQNTSLISALVQGGDAHNVLDFFPTLKDQHLAELYSPIWDIHVAVWSPDAVARGVNDAQTDANQIRQLATQGLITSPGGVPLGSANQIINCPVFGFLNDPPTTPVVGKPAAQPTPVAE